MSYPNAQDNGAGATPVWIVAGGGPGVPPGLVFKSFAQIADLSLPIGLTFPGGTTMALVQVNSGIVRYRRDGVSPSGTVGMLMYATGPAQSFTESDDLEFIQNTGSTGSLNIEYYGPST
jgi:hypothetical protein